MIPEADANRMINVYQTDIVIARIFAQRVANATLRLHAMEVVRHFAQVLFWVVLYWLLSRTIASVDSEVTQYEIQVTCILLLKPLQLWWLVCHSSKVAPKLLQIEFIYSQKESFGQLSN